MRLARLAAPHPALGAAPVTARPSGVAPASRRAARLARAGVRIGSTALLALAVLAVFVFALGPRLGAWRTVSILTGSMSPTFEPGDAIISTPEPARDVRAGDVLTFRAPVAGSPTVTHRVTKVVEGGAHPVLRTRGDANRAADPWTARVTEDTVWRQRLVVPHAGTVIEFLRRPGVREATLYGSLTLFLAFGLRSIWVNPGARVD